MQVILLEKNEKLGNLGDIANVKSGYARNYLIPQGKAKPANKANMAVFETLRAELEAKEAAALLDAFAGGRAYFVMIDVVGFDDSVVYSLDLGRHRPRLIAFESKVMQSVRPEALYDVVEFCSMRGYKAVGPVKANHVCVRGD